MTTLQVPVPQRDQYQETVAAPDQGAAYLWQATGVDRKISIDLAVVDQILQEALRGLGSVPKRGAEVGGVLLGWVAGDGTLQITASAPVTCSHSQGSSYALTPHEYREMEAAVARFTPEGSDGQTEQPHAVGFYRTHTREGLSLCADDVRIFDALFPGRLPVILLVRPSVTRVSQGAFFFREEDGMRGDASYLEFPFRRRELTGESEQPAGLRHREQDSLDAGSAWDSGGAGTYGKDTYGENPHQMEALAAAILEDTDEAAKRRQQNRQALDPMELENEYGEGAQPPRGATHGLSAAAPRKGNVPSRPTGGKSGPPPEASIRRKSSSGTGGLSSGRRWALIPLSFLFLLLGLFLGIQSSLLIGPYLGRPLNPFSMDLKITASAKNPGKLVIDWNLTSAPVLGAQDATLYIEDGGAVKPVQLTRTKLTTTAIEYPAVSDTVRARLDIRMRDNAVYSESVEYHR